MKPHLGLAQDKHFIAKYNALLSSMNVNESVLLTTVDIYRLSILQHFMLQESKLDFQT